MDKLLTNQSDLYTAALLGSMLVTLLWEIFYPVRKIAISQKPRWSVNFLLMAINMTILTLAIPWSTVVFALWIQKLEWGLFNQLQISPTLILTISLLTIDLSKYIQHYLFHRLNIFWKIHRVHHIDLECDVTTSVRFHPLETIFSLLVDSCIILLFGIPALTVVIYRLFRVIISTVVHGNISFPKNIDRIVRFFLVTPDVHRIHHSKNPNEHNANFSGGLIWWDILFNTYIDKAAADQSTMPLGLEGYTKKRANSLQAMLLDPLSK